MTDRDTPALDQLLQEVADHRPAVPDDLMAAVLRDAAFVQPRAVPVADQPGLWAMLLDAIGGWPAVGGLAAAGVAGVWLGFAPPVGFDALTIAMVAPTQTVDLLGADVSGAFLVGEVAQ